MPFVEPLSARDALLLQTWAALKGATVPVFSHIQEQAAGVEVPPAQIGLLHQIVASGEPSLTAQEVARRLDVTPATVTAALNRLEEGGLLERIRSNADRRVVQVRVTAKGRGVVEKWRDAFLASLAKTYAPLSDKDLRALVDVLGRVGPPIHGPPGGFGALLKNESKAGPKGAKRAKK